MSNFSRHRDVSACVGGKSHQREPQQSGSRLRQIMDFLILTTSVCGPRNTPQASLVHPGHCLGHWDSSQEVIPTCRMGSTVKTRLYLAGVSCLQLGLFGPLLLVSSDLDCSPLYRTSRIEAPPPHLYLMNPPARGYGPPRHRVASGHREKMPSDCHERINACWVFPAAV